MDVSEECDPTGGQVIRKKELKWGEGNTWRLWGSEGVDSQPASGLRLGMAFRGRRDWVGRGAPFLG